MITKKLLADPLDPSLMLAIGAKLAPHPTSEVEGKLRAVAVAN
jgi:hypothetical protein